MSDQYYRFFQGDYLRDTGDLTLVEHGAYHILLHHYYTQEWLPADRQKLYRICRAFTQEEMTAVDTIVQRYFTENGEGRIKNRKAEEEIAGRRIFLEEQARKAKLGGEATKQKWKEGKITRPDARPVGMPEEGPTPGPPSPSPSPYIKNKQPTKKVPLELPEWVDRELWLDFLEHRKKLRKPMTRRAEEILLKKLTWLKDQGHNPKHLLMTAIERGWLSVFE